MTGRSRRVAAVTDAAGLTARVFVNRAWGWVFGRGLVATPSHFGALGDRPTHPELLDDLAARFVANKWSVKWLVRELVLSSAYRQSGRHDDGFAAKDPDDKWLWRAPRKRLELEQWRDAMLQASGQLDLGIGGAEPLVIGEPADQRRHRRLGKEGNTHDDGTEMAHGVDEEALADRAWRRRKRNDPELADDSDAPEEHPEFPLMLRVRTADADLARTLCEPRFARLFSQWKFLGSVSENGTRVLEYGVTMADTVTGWTRAIA